MAKSKNDEGGLLLGIGAVSRATGIPIPTLRTWERRYGSPTSVRTDGGHRLYTQGTVSQLAQVARALEAGMRARQALEANPDELATLLSSQRPDVSEPPARIGEPDSSPELAPWLEAAVELNAVGLDAVMRADLTRLGTLNFLTERAAPFLEAMGSWWAAGRLSVAQEHHASQRMALFLQSLQRELFHPSDAPVAVVAGLPGERHLLGAKLAATALALAGWRVVDLGGDLPVNDIRAAVNQAGARALVVSISCTADPHRALADLAALGTGLASGVVRFVGGAGASPDVAGWEQPGSIEALVERAMSLAGS